MEFGVFDHLDRYDGPLSDWASMIEWLRAQPGATGTNDVVGPLAFGDLTPAEFTRSVEPFAHHVIPALSG